MPAEGLDDEELSPWRTCPPPDRGRGRGPTTASLSKAKTKMALGGAGVSEANGVPPGAEFLVTKS